MILEKLPEEQRHIKAMCRQKRDELRKRKNRAENRCDKIKPLHKHLHKLKVRQGNAKQPNVRELSSTPDEQSESGFLAFAASRGAEPQAVFAPPRVRRRATSHHMPHGPKLSSAPGEVLGV